MTNTEQNGSYLVETLGFVTSAKFLIGEQIFQKNVPSSAMI
jgi:hypothetical protein